MGLTVKLHGVRGSRPTHKPTLLHYGGHSTSIEFMTEESFHLFLDGGSGLVTRGRQLAKNLESNHFHFLITHTHWDHILGLPFFEPFYSEDNELTFYASQTSRATFNELFLSQQRRENLPIPANRIRAKLNFKTVKPDQHFTIGNNVQITTCQLNHQGITLGYRVEYKGSSVCVLTDNAPIDEGNYMGENMPQSTKRSLQFETEFNDALIDFLRNADTVIFDSHFTEENLKADWGHSTPQRALWFCEKAAAKRLVLFHHAPEDTDNDVDKKVLSIAERAKRSKIELVAAREGDQWIHD